MADSIRERIIQEIQTTLEGITTGAGFANTIVSVQRPMQDANTFQADGPMIVIVEGEDEVIEEVNPVLTRDLTLALVVQTRIDEDEDARSINEVLNSITADVLKAMMADRHRGTLAQDTKPLSELPSMTPEGQTELARLLLYSIRYRHNATDPTIP